MTVYGLYHMSMNINMKDSTFFHVKPGKIKVPRPTILENTRMN